MGNVVYQGSPVVFDPYTDLECHTELALEASSGMLSVTCKTPKRSFALSEATALFRGVDPLVLYRGILYRATTVLPYDIFYRCFEEDIVEVSKERLIDLGLVAAPSRGTLLDNTGAFLQPFSLPVTKQEKEELVFSGYRPRGDHFYCPLDQARGALISLLTLGWTLFDKEGRKLVQATDSNLTSRLEGGEIVVEGAYTYGSVQKSVGEVYRTQGLLSPLDTTTTALLPEKKQRGYRLVGDTLTYDKDHLGLLDSITLPSSLVPRQQVTPSPQFCGQLYPYQLEGLSFLYHQYNSGLCALLADEMGLGKTVQVLAFLSLVDKKALIVAPTSLLFNWEREVRKFLPDKSVQVYSGKDRRWQGCDITITSYALARMDDFPPVDILINDEAQQIKNQRTQTSKAVCAIDATMRIALTGTPIENKLEDLHALFHFLTPGLLEKKEPVDRVKKKIAPFFLRRKKEVVHLPERVEQSIYVTMEEGQKRAYHAFLHEKKTTTSCEVLEKILRLRQICCHPKLLAIDEESGKWNLIHSDLLECVENGHKVLLYSQFTQFLQWIAQTVKIPYLYLDGSTSNRHEVIDQFQEGKFPLFLCSLKAGGVGLNLTRADMVFLVDPWWNEAIEEQAIARAHRIGRKGTLFVRRYLTVDSLEEKMVELQAKKKKLGQTFLEADLLTLLT